MTYRNEMTAVRVCSQSTDWSLFPLGKTRPKAKTVKWWVDRSGKFASKVASSEVAAVLRVAQVEFVKEAGRWRFRRRPELPDVDDRGGRMFCWFPDGGTEGATCPACKKTVRAEHFWAHKAKVVDEEGVVLPVPPECLSCDFARSRPEYERTLSCVLDARKRVEDYLGGEICWPNVSPYEPEVCRRADYPQMLSDHLGELVVRAPRPTRQEMAALVATTGLSFRQLEAWYDRYRTEVRKDPLATERRWKSKIRRREGNQWIEMWECCKYCGRWEENGERNVQMSWAKRTVNVFVCRPCHDECLQSGFQLKACGDCGLRAYVEDSVGFCVACQVERPLFPDRPHLDTRAWMDARVGRPPAVGCRSPLAFSTFRWGERVKATENRPGRN